MKPILPAESNRLVPFAIMLLILAANAAAFMIENTSAHLGKNAKYSPEEIARVDVITDQLPYVLVFARTAFKPSVSQDPNLLVNLDKAASANYTYAYLMVNGTISADKLGKLSQLGVVNLGYQPFHSIKVRVPVQRLDEIVALPFVRWIGYKPILAKIDAQTHNHLQNSSYVGQYQVFLYDDADSTVIRRKIAQTGITVLDYSNFSYAYVVTGSAESIIRLADFDFVNYIEELKLGVPMLDSSRMQTGQDYVVGSWGGSYDGYNVSLGLIDTGYREVSDLPDITECKNDCADTDGHGTHVACIAMGRGSINSRYKGMAPGIATIYVAKTNISGGYDYANDVVWMGNRTSPPLIVSASVAASGYCNGTDAISVEFDKIAFNNNQTNVVAGGNNGHLGAGSITIPGCTKNAITVGAILDYGNGTLGQIWNETSKGSGQGGTFDNRMKPDIVAPGSSITSCSANGPPWGYVNNSGTSMATPHVSGAIAALMQHLPALKGSPDVVKSLVLATALPINGSPSTIGNISGHGKLSIYPAHYYVNESNGWITGTVSGYVNSSDWWGYYDLYVPSDTDRINLVLTWIEPEAALGSGLAMVNDLDFYIDVGANETVCDAGEFSSISRVETKEYLIIDTPATTGTTYRLKACPIAFNSGTSQRYAIGYHVIRGNPRPPLQLTLTSNTSETLPGAPFEVTLDAIPNSYVSSNVFAEILPPGGSSILSMKTFREDAPGSPITWGAGNASIVLGDIIYTNSRNVTWTINATSGNKTITAYSNSDNSEINSTNTLVTVNTKPYFSNCPNASITQDSPGTSVSIDLWSCAHDAEDAASSMTYSLVSQSNSSIINCFVNSNRNVTCDNPAGAYGENNITVRAVDTLAGTNTTVVKVSVNQTIVTMQLPYGWNLIALPLQPNNTAIEEVLSPISGKYSKVSHYNASKQAWNTTDTSVPQGFNKLKNFTIGEAYWLLTNQNASINFTSVQPASVFKQFTPGWNSFGWPYPDKPVATALAPIEGSYVKVQAYNATTGKWLTYDSRSPPSFNTLANLTRGSGYWILAYDEIGVVFNA